jgi:hypothetical protein
MSGRRSADVDIAPNHCRALLDGRRGKAFLVPIGFNANRRYLLNQQGRPFLMVGDSPRRLFLGERYGNAPNIIWMFGNDYQPDQWEDVRPLSRGAG